MLITYVFQLSLVRGSNNPFDHRCYYLRYKEYCNAFIPGVTYEIIKASLERRIKIILESTENKINFVEIYVHENVVCIEN